MRDCRAKEDVGCDRGRESIDSEEPAASYNRELIEKLGEERIKREANRGGRLCKDVADSLKHWVGGKEPLCWGGPSGKSIDESLG